MTNPTSEIYIRTTERGGYWISRVYRGKRLLYATAPNQSEWDAQLEAQYFAEELKHYNSNGE